MDDWLKSNGYWLLPVLLPWVVWPQRTGSAHDRGDGDKRPSVAWRILVSVLVLAIMWAFSSGQPRINVEEEIRKNPRVRAAMVEAKGVGALNRKDYDLAIACFNEAIQLDPT